MVADAGPQRDEGVMVQQGSDPGGAPHVAVLAAGRVVGETMSLALSAQGFEVHDFPYPRARPELLEVRRSIHAFGAEIGVVVAEIDDVAQWRDVLAVVETIPVKWLLVTGSSDTPRWGGLIAAGCEGVVPMTDGLDALVQSVRSLTQGAPAMDPEAREQALAAWQRLGPQRHDLIRRIAALSPREWQVLGLLNEGQSIATIAEAGGVSEGTVRSQVRAIRQKLNVKSQLAAVAAFQEAMEFDRV